MKLKKLFTIGSFAVMSSLLFVQLSCGKYDEGANLSIHTAKARLVNTWSVSKAEMSSTNLLDHHHTAYYVSQSCATTIPYTEQYKITSWNYNFKKDGTFSMTQGYSNTIFDQTGSNATCNPTYQQQSGVLSATGTWEFADGKRKVKLLYGAITDNGSPSSMSSMFNSPQAYETYEINELKNDEMKLSMVINGSKIELTLR